MPEEIESEDSKNIEIEVEVSTGESYTIEDGAMFEGMSYGEIIATVCSAWHGRTGGYSSGYVSEVYPNYVIARVDKDHWKISYSVSDEQISFAENNAWEKVKLQKEWVAKHESELFTIKALSPKSDGEIRIGGYGVLWGDKSKKDLHGEYFTKSTGQLTTVFKAMGSIPFIFNHGVDSKLKATVLGSVDVMEEDDIGLWYETKIKEHELYRKYVQPLIENKALYSSSGTLPAAKKSVKSTGEITSWPIMEMTGTHTPAEHRMLNVPIDKVKSFYSLIESVNNADINDVFKSLSIGVDEQEETTKTESTGDEKSHDDELVKQLFKARLELEELNLSILENCGGSY